MSERPESQPEQPTEVADLVVAAARSVPGVADLHTGTFGEVATYLPGRRIGGVRILDDRCEVHVVAVWGTPVLDIAHQVQAVVSPLVRTPVDVTVQDVVDIAATDRAPRTTVGVPPGTDGTHASKEKP